MPSILKVPGIEKLDGDDLRALVAAAKEIGADPDWLATVISFETGGSFSPSQLNKSGSSAFGLIQFLAGTAASLLGGTKAEASERGKAMSFSEQLQEMVIPYFAWFGKNYDSLEDLYLAVFYPAALNKQPDWVVARVGTDAYSQNAGFDKTRKGYITKADITQTIRNHRDKAKGARITLPGSLAPMVIAAVMGVLGLYLLQPHLPEKARIPRRYLQPIDRGIAMAKQKTSALAALVPLALLGVVAFGWLVVKPKI